MKVLFLSPHYDDAIYSCGATIYDLVQQGHEVEILTLMAGIPSLPLPDTPVLKDNHQRWQAGENPVTARREEDKVALDIVGATSRYLDLPDCIYRVANDTPLYATEESLWKNIHPDDPAPRLLESLRIEDVDIVFAPLGVGEHVDHLIARDYGWQLAQNGIFPVQFYVEYPYLRDKLSVRVAYEAFPAELATMNRQVSEIAMQHKIKAMAAYTSQIKSFWRDASEIDSEVRQTFSMNGQYTEQFALSKH